MIPNKINILGIPFKVNEYPDLFQSDTIHFGEINYQSCEIKLSKTVPDELKFQTLIHEWVHGVLFMLGREDIKSDEQLVQGLSIAIYQTFTILKSEDMNTLNSINMGQEWWPERELKIMYTKQEAE